MSAFSTFRMSVRAIGYCWSRLAVGGNVAPTMPPASVMGNKVKSSRLTVQRPDGIIGPARRSEVPNWMAKAYGQPEYPGAYLERVGRTEPPELPFVELRPIREKDAALLERLTTGSPAEEPFLEGLHLARNRAEAKIDLARATSTAALRYAGWAGKNEEAEADALWHLLRLARARDKEQDGVPATWPKKAALAAYVNNLWIGTMLPMEAIAYLAWWEGWLQLSNGNPPSRDDIRALERLAERHWSRKR